MNVLSLISHLLELELAETVNQGQLPDTPDNLVLLNFGFSQAPDLKFGGQSNVREYLDYPSVNIQVRDKTYENGHKRIIKITNLILNTRQIPQIIHAIPNGAIVCIGRDEKERYEFLHGISLTLASEIYN